MKFSISRVAEGLLALAAALLLAALFVPWRLTERAPAPAVPQTQAPSAPAQAEAPHHHAPPDAVVSLFVKRAAPRPAAAPVPAPEAKKPVEAPWLIYVGFYTRDPGKPCYLLKDTRAGRMIKVSEGDAIDGWSLVAAEGKRMIIRKNDDVYIVIKR